MYGCGVLTRSSTQLSSRISADTVRNLSRAANAAFAQQGRNSVPHSANVCCSSARSTESRANSCQPLRQAAAHPPAVSSARRGRRLATTAHYALQGNLITAPSVSDETSHGSSGSGAGDCETQHMPVLLDEILGFFKSVKLRTFVDGTLGAAGHSCAIAAAHPELQTLVGIDQDATAFDIARPRLAASMDGRTLDVQLHNGNFRQMQAALQAAVGASEGAADGILLDLGVSSMQLDQAERGFSFMRDGPLDMRMGGGASGAASAEALVNTADEAELGRILREWGEERAWRAIAARIVRRREQQPICTTQQLVAAIGGGRGGGGGKGGRRGIHPATRTFQALRIAVNDELGALMEALPAAVDCLAPGGRLAVISFHSLEDRIVKRAFLAAAGRAPEAEPDLRLDWDPRAALQPPALTRLVTRRPVTAGEQEQRDNPRSRSAKLRILERLPPADAAIA